MGREWQIGDPVDYTTDGWMDAQNWSGNHYTENENCDNDESDSTFFKSREYKRKAWDYYNDNKDEDALHYINLALELYDGDAVYWNLKALILDEMKKYSQSEECFNRALEIDSHNTIYKNKAQMLYRWAFSLRMESKKLPNGLSMLKEAREIMLKAMKVFPDENDREFHNKCLSELDTINYYIEYESEYHGYVETLKEYDKYDLFTITGTEFCKTDIYLTPGMSLNLVKEPDNKIDRDAIAVYVEDEKVGYVANGDNTKFKLTSSASQLQDKIPDTVQGEYLFHLSRYAAIQFDIGKIINKKS